MADQAITALPKKTYSGSSQIAATDYLLGIDSAEGYQMLIQDLGEYIINRATASLAGSTQTLASAISALNSKMVQSMARKNFSIKAVVEGKGFNCFITNGMWYQRNQVLIFVSISSNGQYLNHQMIVGNPTECPYTVSASMSGLYPVVSFEYTGDYPGGQIWYVSDLTGIGLTLS